MPVKRECDYAECPVEAAFDIVGGKGQVEDDDRRTAPAAHDLLH